MMDFVTYQYCKVKYKLVMLLNDTLDFDSDGEHMNNDRYEKAVTKYSRLEKYFVERIKTYRILIYKCN